MIHFVLESQEKVRENEFCRVVGTMYMVHVVIFRLFFTDAFGMIKSVVYL